MERWSLDGVLNIYSDLTGEDCHAIAQAAAASKQGLRQIQFARRFPVGRDTLVHLNNIIVREYPFATLRETINGYGAFNNLEFLRWLPDLKKLVIDLIQPASLQPVVDYTRLEDLFLDGRSVSLTSLAGASALTHFVGNAKLSAVEAIATFSNLSTLALSKQRLNNLDFLRPVSQLTSLTLWQGKIKDLAALPSIGRIEQLKFVNVAELSPEQLSPLNEMPFLKRLILYDQLGVRDISWLTNPNVAVEINGRALNALRSE